ncbi:reverse transcriptase domain-containing protein [Tanacetum coccineum]
MHTCASNSELIEPLPKPESTLNRRLRRRNRRVPYDQRNSPPQHPRIVYPSILDINYFRHFLDILRNYDPMDDEPMWAADRVVALTLGSAITIPETANEFAIKGNHLTLVKGNQFDGRTKTDPHKHIHEFLRICDMFKYKDTENEVVRLMMFPLSLTREEKTWLDELNEGTIEMWDELRAAFISRFFPPALFDRLLGEIRAFSQHENESLTDAWLRMKEMLRNCHGHNLSKGNIIKIFYHGLSEITQEVLNAAVGGCSITVLTKLWARMDAMTIKIDAQYKELQFRAKQPTPNLDDDNMPMSLEEEAKFMQTFCKTRFYNDYRDRDSNRDNWYSSGRNDYNRDNYRSNTDDKPYDLQKQFNDFMKSEQSTNAFVKETFMDLKTQLKTIAKNHQASIQNLETKFDRIADKKSGRPSGSLPSNTQPSPLDNPDDQQNNSKNLINFDSDDKDDEPTPQPKTQPTKPKKTTKFPSSWEDLFFTLLTVDVIDEILEEDFDSLQDEGSKILHSIKGTILEEEIFSEFDEFIAKTANENSESESDIEEPPFEKITINTDYKIKTSLEEPPMDLKLKPLPDNLEYGSRPRRAESLSESEDSEGGHWKSKSRKQKSSMEEDDLSQL